jgi:flagellar biosynthesis protein FlhB
MMLAFILSLPPPPDMDMTQFNFWFDFFWSKLGIYLVPIFALLLMFAFLKGVMNKG